MPATEIIPGVLRQSHLGKGHVFYMDSFYTSLSLAIRMRIKNKISLRISLRIKLIYVEQFILISNFTLKNSLLLNLKNQKLLYTN